SPPDSKEGKSRFPNLWTNQNLSTTPTRPEDLRAHPHEFLPKDKIFCHLPHRNDAARTTFLPNHEYPSPKKKPPASTHQDRIECPCNKNQKSVCPALRGEIGTPANFAVSVPYNQILLTFFPLTDSNICAYAPS